MEKPRQIPFDLLSRTAYAREDFRVSSCNSEAMAWIDRWPAWPAPLLTLNGAPGSGKTHLARIWQEKSKACIPEDSEQMEDVRPDPPAFLLDDIERFIGSPERENRLFHLYNRMKEKGGHILITGLNPPAAWKISLPDLRSRLVAAPAVAILPPDDALMTIVLMKGFSDRQIFVPQEAIAFILPRIERSFSAARDLVDAIDKKALAEKRAVTVPLVRDLFRDGKN